LNLASKGKSFAPKQIPKLELLFVIEKKEGDKVVGFD
jgi:hypothetical protein